MKYLGCLFILFVAIVADEVISTDKNVIFDLSNTSYTVTRNGKTYYFNVLINSNWYEAYQLCRQNGFQLISIQSQEENEWLTKFIIKHGWMVIKLYTKYYFWTSGTNLGGDRYVWISTGKPVTYTNWAPDEPNNSNNIEHCIEVRSLNSSTFTWNDTNCMRKDRHCICEKTLNC